MQGKDRAVDSVESRRRAGEELLKKAAPLLAYDALAEGLKAFPGDVRLRQLMALALARTGATRLANQLLVRLAAEGHTDEETLGLLARTYKDLWADTDDAAQQQRCLQLAFHHYLEAYKLSTGYWSGINAATMKLLLGEEAQAQALARDVRRRCLELLRAGRGTDVYWLSATLGEAALILREWSEAVDWYSQAAAVGAGRLGDLVSTRRNARLIVRYLEADGASVESCFHTPQVVVFCGHLIDAPGRSFPRFPPALETDIRQALGARLQGSNVGFGYASAGCGSDILFLETIRELGAEMHIVLPYNRYQFRRDSVDIVPNADWVERYEQLLEQAAEVTTASDERLAGGAMSYEYGFLLLDGMAGLRAAELETGLLSLAVWDGSPGDGPGGTAASVAKWRAAGRRVEIIHIDEILRRRYPQLIDPPDTSVTADTAVEQPASAFDPQIVGLLFADVRGFSKLTEDEIPLFVQHFLGAVAAVLVDWRGAPLVTNTWGDGLYFVFRTVQEAGEFALQLCEVIRDIDWGQRGLPNNLSLRIGLHAGPAYACLDPVTQRPNYLGSHVSLAARIEPITPPGEVYASGAFAALTRAGQIHEFVCAYVGQTPLAKGYGSFPTYVVHRRRNWSGSPIPGRSATGADVLPTNTGPPTSGSSIDLAAKRFTPG